jgi:2-hydroxychromene-2-carboxylate isomerase
MRSSDWYFDFISPYSYIAWHRLKELPSGLSMVYRPVLFAGLLNHWGQKGPAEIPAKRRWTYRWCTWWAAQLDIPFRFPASHPFNPLHHLRLAIAAECAPAAIQRIFEDIWTTGEDAADPARFSRLCTDVGIAPDLLASPKVKDLLRQNTQEAAALGIFGVPTLAIDGEHFWGADAIDFARQFIADASVLRNPEMKRVDSLPVGAERKT